jgi:hypothetical protein
MFNFMTSINGVIYKLKKSLKLNLFIYKSSLDKLEFETVSDNPDFHLDIYTIVFNNLDFIQFQIQLLKKNITDSFTHIIIDNSSDFFIRSAIRNYCQIEKVHYYGLPNNPYFGNKSHAVAMHWAFKNVVRKRNSKYFGFLDHDIFPTQSYSIVAKMKNKFYGRVVHSYSKDEYNNSLTVDYPYWSLWAGFCFFETSIFYGISQRSLNFFSRHFNNGAFLDTGGGLWDKLYKKLDYPGEMATYRVEQLIDPMENEEQDQNFEILDESWIHFVSLSNWRIIGDLESRKEAFRKILNSCILDTLHRNSKFI